MKTYQTRITCDECEDAYETPPSDAPEGKLEMTLLAAGWFFGPKDRHLCPECRKKEAL